MMTRREALGVLSSMSVGSAFIDGIRGLTGSISPNWGGSATQGGQTPLLAPGAPLSQERVARIDAFRKDSEGLDQHFEARVHNSDWAMPYRLFRPKASGKLPVVMYLHGSGGQGSDNLKQMGLGNTFGTRVWALPANQEKYPCYVVVPQTDRGWVNYGPPAPGDSVARVIPGLGAGAKLALEIVNALSRELPIDESRIYLTGQSMGGGGVWHMTAQRPHLFAAAIPCCGSATLDKPADSASTPLWNFHGDADQTVPVAVSRDRIAALRKAGAGTLSTEYAGVNHNSWEWAYTEPALVAWMFGQRRPRDRGGRL
jgi:predicted peptidase